MNALTPIPSLGVRSNSAQARQRQKRHNRLRLLLLLGVATLVLSTVLIAANYYRGQMALMIQVGDQQIGQIDLNQSVSISPYLFGSNAFPQAGTLSKDQGGKGFMNYDQSVVLGLQSANVKLLRFPGGNWDEQHVPSAQQLDAFSALLNEVGAQGMMQVPLSDPNDATPVSLQLRASRASLLVEYMNNSNSIQRQSSQAAFHPITYWTIGNEPDLLINPDTGATYTVKAYTDAFIAYSLAMHERDPHIKIFGPEISAYQGQQEPKDANGQPWMEEFLREIAAYEHTHSLPFRVLDGVSFHYYPFGDTQVDSGTLLNEPAHWDSAIPALRQFIRAQFGEDLPIALTEINTNSGKHVPPQDQAAVWWADTLGKLTSNQVEYVAFFSTEGVNTPYPLFNQGNLQATAMLRVMQLFTHLQHNFVPFQDASNSVSIYASQDQAHGTVSLLLINKTAEEQQVAVQADTFLPFSSWQHAHVALSPYSIGVLTLHRNKSDELFNFSNSEDTQQAVPDVQHLLCNGHTGSIQIC